MFFYRILLFYFTRVRFFYFLHFYSFTLALSFQSESFRPFIALQQNFQKKSFSFSRKNKMFLRVYTQINSSILPSFFVCHFIKWKKH
ncbi:unnamed protein product [Meloidogyne enterolobii]|uniref:Uncharacterized protein n=1 Tax=Meloidogyne enterolobii TaxID=390850 RepID=A0ACB0Y6M1_MELEN